MSKSDKYDWTYKIITEEEYRSLTAGSPYSSWKTKEKSYWKHWFESLSEVEREQLLIVILEHLEKK